MEWFLKYTLLIYKFTSTKNNISNLKNLPEL